MPFVDLGLVPELGASRLVPWLVGKHKAARAMLLGDFFDAAAAERMGFVNRILDRAELLPNAMATAQALAAKPQEAMRLTKRLLRPEMPPLIARMEEEREILAERLRAPEAGHHGQCAEAQALEGRRPMSLLDMVKGRLSLPVIGSPLFIISVPDLVVAQCTAGIIGSMPSLNARPAEQFEEWVIEIKERLAAHDAAPPGPAGGTASPSTLSCTSRTTGWSTTWPSA
ncbi:enoyl-CoA hydratase-related protein [Dankookia sp. P2]|uniref:enoyl-CoA hydratase-related protein n=1 Tax=Dankookia sp. P2 TaxID=3423955 RepID=UPI003D6641BF